MGVWKGWSTSYFGPRNINELIAPENKNKFFGTRKGLLL
jgi:hypothetical protein